MDQETLTNHLSKSGKSTFEIACRIIFRDIFNLHAINVDGKDDGGTDFISVNKNGSRSNVAYQITTQKSDIKNKSYSDAKKAINKLGAERFYFLTTINLNETEARKIENNITKELNIQAYCFGSKHIAGFLIEESLAIKFLDESGYPVPTNSMYRPDYKEMALHAYTLMSKDARNMREGIYDDTIMFILSDNSEMYDHIIIEEVIKFLGLEINREKLLQNRIGALFGKGCIKKNQNGTISLSQKSIAELSLRKRIYEKELIDLASAQIDIMRSDFNSNWTLEDSKSVSVFIADSFVSDQIETLKEIKASIIINPIFNSDDKGVNNLKSYLVKKRKVPPEQVNIAVEKLIKAASNHPLITKLSRASVYVALEGSNPISCARALGAGRWCDYKILIEPTVAIPWICNQLYKGNVNSFFNSSINSLNRAKELDINMKITYFYINECAGHLLRARKYAGLELDFEELRFSPNAFISNYYSMITNGKRVPNDLLDYLKSFSPSVKLERHDIKEWVRSVMTDLQTILTRSGVEFIESPKYRHDQCSLYEKEYIFNMNKYKLEKSTHLINHDVWSLQFTHDLIANEGQHWLILTYDRSMIDIGKGNIYPGWVTTPDKFLDLTENNKPLSDARYISLLHSFANYSERTLSAGARVIDRIVQYASSEMQDWEFRKDLEEFKNDILNNTDLTAFDAMQKIDASTDEFLAKHGIKVNDRKINDEEDVD